MIKKLLAALALACLQSTSSSALPVNPGDTLRGAYSFPTTGTTELEPLSFFLRLFSSDPFGGSDSVGIRYLDNTLRPLSFTRVDAGGTGLDTTIGIVFDRGDFLPGVLGPTDPPRVPQSGFIEITGLAGSFDVSSLTLSATERLTATGILRRSVVSEFGYVTTPPTVVPLPAAALFLISAILGLFGLRIGRSRGRGRPGTAPRMLQA